MFQGIDGLGQFHKNQFSDQLPKGGEGLSQGTSFPNGPSLTLHMRNQLPTHPEPYY